LHEFIWQIQDKIGANNNILTERWQQNLWDVLDALYYLRWFFPKSWRNICCWCC